MARHKPMGILKKDAVAARPPRLKPKKDKKPQPAPAPRPAAGVPKAKPQSKHDSSAARSAAAAAALLQGGAGGSDSADQQQQQQEQKEWMPHSPVVRFAAEALAKLLAADESQRSGKTIKSLTLAPHVTTKKATFALTCQTLRCECQLVIAHHIPTAHIQVIDHAAAV